MITINANMIDGVIVPSRELTQEEKDTVIATYFLGQSYLHYQIGEEYFVAERERGIEIITMDIQSDPSSIDAITAMMQDYGDKYLQEYVMSSHQINLVVE